MLVCQIVHYKISLHEVQRNATHPPTNPQRDEELVLAMNSIYELFVSTYVMHGLDPIPRPPSNKAATENSTNN